MLLLLVVFIVAWVMTAVDVLRRPGLSAGRRAAWLITSLVLPFPTILVYWLIRPLPKKRNPPRARARSLDGAASPLLDERAESSLGETVD
jgi:Phospholipase_D-nuclease N-terminal